MNRINLAALVTAATLAALAAAPASARAVQLGATCVASDRIPTTAFTTCATPRDAVYTFNAEGGGTIYGLKITAPATHCSAVQYQVWSTTDANLMYGKTQGFLEAGQSQVVPIGRDFGRGPQTVAIRVLGHVGGCNTGRMHSWAGIVEAVIIPE